MRLTKSSSSGQMKLTDCRFGVHALDAGGRGFESHQRNSLMSRCSSVVERRNTLATTSSVLLNYARLPGRSTW